MKSLYSCSALSLAYPYFCCKSPRSFSLFPSTWVRSSSVSLPHFSLTPPLISFHFPFRISSFMFALLSSCSRKQGCPANVHLPLCQGPAQRSTPSSLHDLSTLKDIDQHHHDRDDQENVNESSHRERGDQPNKPEEDQYDRNGPEHFRPLLPGFSAKPSKRSGLFETSSPIREGCTAGLTHIDANVEGVRRIQREESPCQPQQVVVVVRLFCCSHLHDSANGIFGLPAVIHPIDRDRSQRFLLLPSFFTQ